MLESLQKDTGIFENEQRIFTLFLQEAVFITLGRIFFVNISNFSRIERFFRFYLSRLYFYRFALCEHALEVINPPCRK
jgi:hypothetical protein